MSWEQVLILGLCLTVVALAATLLGVSLGRRRSRDLDALSALELQFESLRSDLSAYQQRQSLAYEQTHVDVNEHMDRAARSVAEVHHQLGALEEATDHMLGVGRTVAGIEDLLRAPKLRGIFGETLLAELLSQVLPDSLFELQFPLRGGERVDAVVRVGKRYLPVDAKFPLENFRRMGEARDATEREAHRKTFARDFKKHVDDVASKYVAPDADTLPIAFVYIPAENVYQQGVLADAPLTQYALQRRVVPTGPLGLFAFLQTVLLGARSLSAPDQASELLAGVEHVGLELEELGRELSKLARHLDYARAGMDQVGKRQRRLLESVDRARASLDTALLASSEKPRN